MTSEATAAIRSIARWELPTGAGRAADGPVSVTDDQWPAFVRRLIFEKLSGLAVEAIARGSLVVPESRAEEVLEVHRNAMVTSLMLERALVDVGTALDSKD